MNPVVIETFHNPEGSITKQSEPSCFNGVVKVHKYRVTIERVDESPHILAGRLLKLWRECDNHHHWTPLQKMAKQLGVILDPDECGINRNRK